MTEHFDVLIVGAGISGIAAAYHLQDQLPETTFALLETQDSFGGTWKTHRYPGIRSDSDLYTFGYRFKPWSGLPIAPAKEILAYMGEVIAENDIARHIRYGHTVTHAHWSSEAGQWTLHATDHATGDTKVFTAGFLWMCQGYYRHSEGFTPQWQGMDSFAGQIVHPQTWPEDLETEGKRIVVIGSGATAATIVPALAGHCAHVTMLQRSPTYFNIRPNVHELAQSLREIDIDEALIHQIVRRRILFDQDAFVRRCAEEPEAVRQDLQNLVRAYAGDTVDVARHFTPHYQPWKQRIAMVPDGDLFTALRDGHASVVTDEIARFTKTGIMLKSGEALDAEIVVTATGFNLSALGDIAFSIDGEALSFHETLTYRGMMFTGMPNMVWVFGYLRASWTLRAELVADFVCRMLAHMKATGAQRVEPRPRASEADIERGAWIDPKDFNPGYLMRGLHLLPQSGPSREWQHTQDYWHEKDEFPAIDLDDEVFVYDGRRSGA